jgi:hypothetical protein
MAEIVNLKREKKRRARAEQAQVAAENRIRFGRTIAEKSIDKSVIRRQNAAIDGASLESLADPAPKCE